MKLKDDDEVVTVTNNSGSEVFVTTKNGYGLRYKVEEISEVGLRAAGVKAISLKNDIVICAHVFETMDYLSVITDKGTAKRIKLLEFEPLQRARKGILMVRDVKTNPYSIIKTFIIPAKESIMLKLGLDYKEVKLTELPITDRYSTGTVITKSNIEDIFETTKLMKESSKDEVAEEPTILEKESREELLNKVDEKILTIDDFLDDFKFKD
jgi:topoisomerase-4 subunit A